MLEGHIKKKKKAEHLLSEQFADVVSTSHIVLE
jgi:hypothetical protein